MHQARQHLIQPIQQCIPESQHLCRPGFLVSFIMHRPCFPAGQLPPASRCKCAFSNRGGRKPGGVGGGVVSLSGCSMHYCSTASVSHQMSVLVGHVQDVQTVLPILGDRIVAFVVQVGQPVFNIHNMESSSFMLNLLCFLTQSTRLAKKLSWHDQSDHRFPVTAYVISMLISCA